MEQNKKYIRLAADLQSDSIVDGPGLRTVIWTQGCSHHCKGCQNPQTWSFKGGGLVKVDDVLEAIDELECQTGITFSGGDPMFQVEACNRIAEYCKSKGYNIWVYTGFTYEEILDIIDRYGLPQDWNDDGAHGPERYIEVQVWTDEPIKRYI